MKSFLILLSTLFVLTVYCQKPASTKKTYQANWESLKKHETPKWFLDAKFGVYCHWGPYSVPAYKNEWYSHWMYVQEGNPEAGWKEILEFNRHHVKTYGTLDTFGYKDFIPLFKAEKFDAAAWADLFQKSGAKFAGPVSEHADGFAMWDSDLTRWNAKNMGPKRDVMGELSKEIRKRGMKFIATYHRQWLYGWYPTWDDRTDTFNPEYADLYGPKLKKGDFVHPLQSHEIDNGVKKYYPLADEKFNKDWLNRLKEIVDKYNPDLVWFDNKMDIIGENYRKEFLSYYYNQAAKKQQEVVSTYKFYDFVEGTAVLDLERSRMKEKKNFPWLTDDSIDWNSWSHISNPKYKSTNRLIDFLVDVVSKNGVVLLNITPKANGEIPVPVKKRLLEIGAWLKINGEAIYGTRTFEVYGEGDFKAVEGHLSERKNKENTAKDIRFTTKGNILYATVLDWPNGSCFTIKTLKKGTNLFTKKIESVELLGYDKQLSFKRTLKGLTITLPKKKAGKHAFVFKIFAGF